MFSYHAHLIIIIFSAIVYLSYSQKIIVLKHLTSYAYFGIITIVENKPE